ncbi:MAG TPA: hypothetical protein VHG91_09620 [Longimicrobium sp.]|nr:hypothetical protein [Longimicrobium sp.]
MTARRAPVLLLLALLATPSASVAAQTCPFSGCPADPSPRRGTRLETAGINALLGGATAGALRLARGGSGRDALRAAATGAAGGALVYAGKRVSVERWDGAGLAGRELAAVGASVVYNASSGRGALSRVALPFGPVRLWVHADSGFRVRPRLDVGSAVATVAMAGQRGSSLDWGESLSAGAPVFRRAAGFGVPGSSGRHVAGVVQVDDPDDPLDPDEVRQARDALAHERVHVLQNDQAYLFWGAPLEDALLGGTRAGRALRRHLDLGLHLPLTAFANEMVDYDARPWEREAYLLNRPGEEEGGYTGR